MKAVWATATVRDDAGRLVRVRHFGEVDPPCRVDKFVAAYHERADRTVDVHIVRDRDRFVRRPEATS